jgi:hypothetical protein
LVILKSLSDSGEAIFKKNHSSEANSDRKVREGWVGEAKVVKCYFKSVSVMFVLRASPNFLA